MSNSDGGSQSAVKLSIVGEGPVSIRIIIEGPERATIRAPGLETYVLSRRKNPDPRWREWYPDRWDLRPEFADPGREPALWWLCNDRDYPFIGDVIPLSLFHLFKLAGIAISEGGGGGGDSDDFCIDWDDDEEDDFCPDCGDDDEHCQCWFVSE
jgi:hypothetical protein